MSTLGNGVVVGVVKQTTGDPDKLGRIQVSYPWLGSEIRSGWCRVASFFAGPKVGAYFLPAVGDEVLVAFDCGDLSVGYVIGSLWNGQDKPPVEAEADQQHLRLIQTRGGSQIRIEDDEGKELIEIKDKAGTRLTFDVANKKVSLVSAKDVEITAGSGGTLSLKADIIQVQASKEVTVSGTNQATLSSDSGPVAIKGTTIGLNS